jgi:hypothetical protein
MREFDIGTIETANINMPEVSENFGGVKVRYHEAVLYDRDRTNPKYYTFKTNTEKPGNATPEAFVEGDKILLLGTPYTILDIDSRMEEIILGTKTFEGAIGINQPIVYKSLQIELIEENEKTWVQFRDKEESKRHELQTKEAIYFKNAAVRIKQSGETTTLTLYTDVKEIQNGGTFEGYTIDWREVDFNNLFAAYNGDGEIVVNKENYNRVAQYGAIYGIRMKGTDSKIGPNIKTENDTVIFKVPDVKSYATETYGREVRIMTDKEFEPSIKASAVYIIGGPDVNDEWEWLSSALKEKGMPGFILNSDWHTLADYKPYMKKSLTINGTTYITYAGVDRAGTYRSVFGSLEPKEEEPSVAQTPRKTSPPTTTKAPRLEQTSTESKEKSGICGPSAIILFAFLPFVGTGLLKGEPHGDLNCKK